MQEMFVAGIARVQSGGLYVLAGAAIIAFVLTFMIARSAAKARNRKRELDEYMRVAQQTASAAPQSFKKDLTGTEPLEKPDAEAGEPPAAQKLPELKVIRGGKTKKRKLVQPEIISVSDELYFQPVTNVSGGQIIGYDIYRQAMQTSRRNAAYIQTTPANGNIDQAEFELETLQKAAEATQYEMWTNIAEERQISFFIHLGAALLDDKTHWRRAAIALRKQSRSNPSITLAVCSSSFANATKKTVNDRLQKLQKLQSSGVPLMLYGFQHDPEMLTEEQLGSFDLFCCGKDELTSCQSGEASPGSILAYQQVIEAALGIYVRGIASDTDVVDCMAAGAKFMSGDFLAPPRKLKSDRSGDADAAE